MLSSFKAGFRRGQGKVLTGIKDREKKGEKEKGHLGGESIRPFVRPCRQKLPLSKGLWPLGGQVKCPAKGFSPAACGRPSTSSSTSRVDPNLGKGYCHWE
jgi:hypothetical protein